MSEIDDGINYQLRKDAVAVQLLEHAEMVEARLLRELYEALRDLVYDNEVRASQGGEMNLALVHQARAVLLRADKQHNFAYNPVAEGAMNNE